MHTYIHTHTAGVSVNHVPWEKEARQARAFETSALQQLQEAADDMNTIANEDAQAAQVCVYTDVYVCRYRYACVWIFGGEGDGIRESVSMCGLLICFEGA